MNKKKILPIIAIIVAISIIFASYVYLVEDEKKAEVEPPIKEIDDRISPLTQQAVHIKIQRIRRKGAIIDQMMNDIPGVQFARKLPIKDSFTLKAVESLFPGRGWDEKPIFNFKVLFDDEEFSGPVDYKAWDTKYIHNTQYKLTEEWNEEGTGYVGEREKINLQILVIQKEKKLLKTTSKIAETINLEYDFRTGRWTGDDFFNDTDGYGHYNGTDYEVWFYLAQTDIDNDGIPFWTEVNVLGTDPEIDDSKLDPDNDGLPTSYEWKWGYDTENDEFIYNPFEYENHSVLDPDNDGLQNTEEYYMQDYLANPYYPELYIEVDHMEKAPFRPVGIKMKQSKIIPSIQVPKIAKTGLDGWEHQFYEESQQMIMDRFNEHGITVHVDDGCMGEGGDVLPYAKTNYETDELIYGNGAFAMEKGLISQYYFKYFPKERIGIFRYLLVLHGGGETFNLDYSGTYDTMTVPMNKNFYKSMLMDMGGTQRIRRVGVAISILHELGHTCGIGLMHHGGVDNTTANVRTVWNDYKSVMNYMKYSERLFDYSDGSHGEMDKDDWEVIDPGYFQRTSAEIEGLGFNKHTAPFYR